MKFQTATIFDPETPDFARLINAGLAVAAEKLSISYPAVPENESIIDDLLKKMSLSYRMYHVNCADFADYDVYVVRNPGHVELSGARYKYGDLARQAEIIHCAIVDASYLLPDAFPVDSQFAGGMIYRSVWTEDQLLRDTVAAHAAKINGKHVINNHGDKGRLICIPAKWTDQFGKAFQQGFMPARSRSRYFPSSDASLLLAAGIV